MRLIDADSISLKDIPMDMGGLVYIEDVLLKIEELPTVNTVPTKREFKRIAIQRGYVPVVRCGECIKRGTYRCTLYPGDEIDDFCSYGEMRNDDV